MNKPQQNPPRVRLQELQAIPDRQRTEAEWDELNELEIMLAAGNRERGPEQNVRRNDPMQGGHQKPGGGQQQHGKKPGRKFHRRPPKGNTP